jgi:hypothetical protein
MPNAGYHQYADFCGHLLKTGTSKRIDHQGTKSQRKRQQKGELQGALADGFTDGLVGGDGVEPFGLRLALVSQEVNQTRCFKLRSQLW